VVPGVDHSFAWGRRFRRLTRDDERLLATVGALHFIALASVTGHRFVAVVAQSP
jgi:hypothetical protein